MIRLFVTFMMLSLFMIGTEVYAESPGKRHGALKEAKKAYKAERKAKKADFRATLDEMSEEDRKAARKEFWKERKAEHQEFREGMYEQRVNAIQNNAHLSDEEKAERLEKIHEIRAEGKAHLDKQHAENKAFRETLSGMTRAEKRAAVQLHRSTQKKENKEFKQLRKAMRKDNRPNKK